MFRWTLTLNSPRGTWETQKSTGRKFFVLKSKKKNNGALSFFPSNSIICLAIAKHSTSSWTQRLHGDARRQQHPAVGCFSAAGPGRLVKTEGTWMQKNITKDNLNWFAKDQLGGTFIFKKKTTIQNANVNVLEWPSQSLPVHLCPSQNFQLDLKRAVCCPIPEKPDGVWGVSFKSFIFMPTLTLYYLFLIDIFVPLLALISSFIPLSGHSTYRLQKMHLPQIDLVYGHCGTVIVTI